MIQSHSKKATREMTREHNERLVLKLIYENDPISRAQLARLTGLTRATVSSLVARLMDEGLVLESGTTKASVGKPATMLEFNAEAGYIIALDLGNSQFGGVLTNLRGVNKLETEHEWEHERGEAAINKVFSLVGELLSKSDRPVFGIGIGTPGVVDPNSGVVKRSADLEWENVPLRDLLEERFDLEVYIANDSQTAALGQFVFGSGKKEKNLILVKAGRGIGAGIIINGNIFYGDGFGAGEIGHVVVDPKGELCGCGQVGCLDTEVGIKSMIRKLRKRCEQKDSDPALKPFCKASAPTSADLKKLHELGQRDVHLALNEGAQALGSALAFLIGALNIGFVYLTGSMTQFGEDFIQPLQEQTKGCSLPFLMDRIQIKVSDLGKSTVSLGATALVLQQKLGLV